MGTTYSITISNFLHNKDEFKIELNNDLLTISSDKTVTEENENENVTIWAVQVRTLRKKKKLRET